MLLALTWQPPHLKIAIAEMAPLHLAETDFPAGQWAAGIDTLNERLVIDVINHAAPINQQANMRALFYQGDVMDGGGLGRNALAAGLQ